MNRIEIGRIGQLGRGVEKRRRRNCKGAAQKACTGVWGGIAQQLRERPPKRAKTKSERRAASLPVHLLGLQTARLGLLSLSVGPGSLGPIAYSLCRSLSLHVAGLLGAHMCPLRAKESRELGPGPTFDLYRPLSIFCNLLFENVLNVRIRKRVQREKPGPEAHSVYTGARASEGCALAISPRSRCRSSAGVWPGREEGARPDSIAPRAPEDFNRIFIVTCPPTGALTRAPGRSRCRRPSPIRFSIG